MFIGKETQYLTNLDKLLHLSKSFIMISQYDYLNLQENLMLETNSGLLDNKS